MDNNVTIIKGLCLKKSEDNNKYLIRVTSGMILPDVKKTIWNSKYTYINENDTLIQIYPNNDNVPVINYIVAKPGTGIKNNYTCNIEIYCKEIPKPSKRNESSEELEPEFPDNLLNEEILLGVILNEPIMNNSTIKALSLNDSLYSNSIELLPSEFRKKHIYKISNWSEFKLYIKEQIIVYNNTLYQCKLTHVSSTIFLNDLKYFWNAIVGISELQIKNVIDNALNDLKLENTPNGELGAIQLKGNTSFSSSEYLMWNSVYNMLNVNGYLKLKLNNNELPTINNDEFLLYIENSNNIMSLKLKSSNDEYILASFIVSNNQGDAT